MSGGPSEVRGVRKGFAATLSRGPKTPPEVAVELAFECIAIVGDA